MILTLKKVMMFLVSNCIKKIFDRDPNNEELTFHTKELDNGKEKL